MSISVNIGGVNKEVSQPYVDIGGTWKECDTVSNNIDGVWKKSFSAKVKYTIYIYRYGSLYRTLSCTEGSSVVLPTIDDGYGLSSNSTSKSYSNGQAITPKGNMTLYVLFTHTVKLYNYGVLYRTLTAMSTTTTASFSLPTVTPSSSDNAFLGWTKTSGSTTKNYTGDSTVNLSSTSLYAIFSYYEYTGQTSATASGQTDTDSSAVQTLQISLTNPVPLSSYTVHSSINTPEQITETITNGGNGSGSKYSIGYKVSTLSDVTHSLASGETSVAVYSNYKPTAYTLKEGVYVVTPGGLQDTVKNVTKYSYVSGGVEYTKYTSKTLKFRSVK